MGSCQAEDQEGQELYIFLLPVVSGGSCFPSVELPSGSPGAGH